MKYISLSITSCILFVSLITQSVLADSPGLPSTLMCVPGEILFEESFDPDTISPRWGFKSNFVLRDGAFVRSKVNPNETTRVFLKDPEFHNTVIQFDFKFSGKTTDLRLVTGGDGHYNSVTQLRRDYFQVNTPVDREAGIVPSHIGESKREAHPDQWQTITIEYFNDEFIAHLNDKEFILGKHPIIDRTRRYFAFQFDLPGAAIDNVRVWKAARQLENWSQTRLALNQVQAKRPEVKRDPAERYKYESTNLKSRLTLHDPAYRKLVATHEKLQAELKESYPEAFITHKYIGKKIANKKKQIKASDPEFKTMEIAVHRARRDEDDYVLSTKPELIKLKEESLSKSRFPSELGQVRDQLEASGDKKLAALVAKTAKLQAALESRFPEAFESIDSAVETRNSKRKALNTDPKFQARNQLVVEAGRAIKDYEKNADARVAQLAEEAAIYSDSLKSQESK